VVRILLFLLVAALPLLAISAHVFGLIAQRTSATFVILPLATAVVVLAAVAPHPTDRIVGRGLVTGMVACLIYDSFRLFTVYALGWMGDFIPTMGTWITGDPDPRTGAAVGYLWRYLGDGGGLGVAFWIIAFAVGMDRWSGRPARIVITAVGFAVFPVWTGLIATAAMADRGEEMLFGLTPANISITLIGHVIFGLVLGIGFVRSCRHCKEWTWPPVSALSATQVRDRVHQRVGVGLLVAPTGEPVRIQHERQTVRRRDLRPVGQLKV
jgi:hypothetical protein